MTHAKQRRRPLRSDARGATLAEFGIIIIPFCFVLLAFLDFGHRLFLTAQLHGTLQQAARLASIGNSSENDIDNYVKNSVAPLIDRNYVTINKQSYTNFSRIGKPEKITSDTAPIGSYNVGDCFEDGNGNGSYDATGGRSGLGGADDIVHYEVAVSFPRMLSMKGFGWSERETVKANMVLRNQPYAVQAKPAVVCTK